MITVYSTPLIVIERELQTDGRLSVKAEDCDRKAPIVYEVVFQKSISKGAGKELSIGSVFTFRGILTSKHGRNVLIAKAYTKIK